MKTSIKKAALTLFAVGTLTCANAQKIAHVDLDSLIGLMPETKTAKDVAQAYLKDLEKTMSSMENEFQTKYQDYQLHVKDYTELIKGVKEKEMQDLQQRIQDFQQTAQQEIQKENERLIKPVNDRAHKAIKEVANEKGYKLVLDSGLESVLYSEPSDDILPLVKAKLKTMK